jgi:hypothetical protein
MRQYDYMPVSHVLVNCLLSLRSERHQLANCMALASSRDDKRCRITEGLLELRKRAEIAGCWFELNLQGPGRYLARPPISSSPLGLRHKGSIWKRDQPASWDPRGFKTSESSFDRLDRPVTRSDEYWSTVKLIHNENGELIKTIYLDDQGKAVPTPPSTE